MSRQHISRNPALPFSDAVLVDDRTLYISGRLGLIPGTREVPELIDQEIVYLM